MRKLSDEEKAKLQAKIEEERTRNLNQWNEKTGSQSDRVKFTIVLVVILADVILFSIAGYFGHINSNPYGKGSMYNRKYWEPSVKRLGSFHGIVIKKYIDYLSDDEACYFTKLSGSIDNTGHGTYDIWVPQKIWSRVDVGDYLAKNDSICVYGRNRIKVLEKIGLYSEAMKASDLEAPQKPIQLDDGKP